MRDFSKLAAEMKEKARARNRALLPIRDEAKAKANHFDQIADALREHKTIEFVSAPELFPTPYELGRRMVHLAEIEPEHTILEPSAGTGQLAGTILLQTQNRPLCCEINLKLQALLRSKHYQVIGIDFLEHAGKYDRIIMNPPFSEQQDITHVKHAYALLKPAGRIVAIMSAGVTYRQDRRASDMRALIDRCGYLEENEPDAFKASGTTVRTVTVVLNRPQEQDFDQLTRH